MLKNLSLVIGQLLVVRCCWIPRLRPSGYAGQAGVAPVALVEERLASTWGLRSVSKVFGT
jgi:hypothetical protein